MTLTINPAIIIYLGIGILITAIIHGVQWWSLNDNPFEKPVYDLGHVCLCVLFWPAVVGVYIIAALIAFILIKITDRK